MELAQESVSPRIGAPIHSGITGIAMGGRRKYDDPLREMAEEVVALIQSDEIFIRISRCIKKFPAMSDKTIRIIGCVEILLKCNFNYFEIGPRILSDVIALMEFSDISEDDINKVMGALEMSVLATTLVLGERPDLQEACRLFQQEQPPLFS